MTDHKQSLQLLPSLLDSLGVGGVDHVDQGISIREVVSPILSEGFLSSDVPHVELELIVREVLDIEALSRGDR
jgi:hypothetical protein